ELPVPRPPEPARRAAARARRSGGRGRFAHEGEGDAGCPAAGHAGSPGRDGVMDCDSNRKSIVLLLCGELQETERAALEAHLRECFDCQATLAEERRILRLVEGASGDEPAEELLEACRRDLRAAMSPWPGGRPAPSRPWVSLWPAWAFALLAAGFTAGRLYPDAGLRGRAGDATTPEAGATIANVDFRDSDPRTERISLTYDTLRRTAVEGTVGDPRIRQVLLETV